MTRIKGGIKTRRRHNKVLALTRGQRATRHSLYKRAHEAMLHSLRYAYFHRRERKGDFRRLWIVRINAAARQLGLSYSQFMAALKRADIAIDRKMLADMAVRDAAGFQALVEKVRPSPPLSPSP